MYKTFSLGLTGVFFSLLMACPALAISLLSEETFRQKLKSFDKPKVIQLQERSDGIYASLGTKEGATETFRVKYMQSLLKAAEVFCKESSHLDFSADPTKKLQKVIVCWADVKG